MKRAMIAVLAATLLLACDESNPLIGKWMSATKSATCNMRGTVEFTEKLAISGPTSLPVKYSRDGTHHVATTGDGHTFVFEKDGDALRMVSPSACRLVKVNTDLFTQGAVCSGIFDVLRHSHEVSERIKRSMSPSDKPLDKEASEAFFKLHDALERALERLMDENILSEEQVKKASESGEATGNKTATYAEAIKHLDECSKTVKQVIQIAGTD